MINLLNPAGAAGFGRRRHSAMGAHHSKGERVVLDHEGDLRRIAPTNEEGRQEACTPPDGRPHSDCTGRSPGVTMPEADSAWPERAPRPSNRITRSVCDRYTCKPGNRCAEHRGDSTQHISAVMADLVRMWQGER